MRHEIRRLREAVRSVLGNPCLSKKSVQARWRIGKRRRNIPYTERGIGRLRCVRCGRKATYQWQTCADHNTWRPLCRLCDVLLNALVLEFMGHPNADELIENYLDMETYLDLH